MAATSRDEFVDLYDVMDLPVDSDSETIRQRLNTLYLEAQQNLDHRNAKKRLQYQQMYEIYLPQSRHLLLDPRRRAEYDRYLTAYHTGNKVTPSEAPAEETVQSPSETTALDEASIPGMAEVQVDPAVIAAEREDMWAKWKMGLEAVGEVTEIPENSLGATAPASPYAASADAAQTRPAPPTPRGYTAPTPRTGGGVPSVPRKAPPAPRRRPGQSLINAANPEPTPEADAAIDLEKQRQQQRYTLVKDAVQNAFLLWLGIYACGIFLVGLIILFFLDNHFKNNYPLGLSQSTFALIGFVFILIAAAVGGFFGGNHSKRRAAQQLSVLSTEELLRRKRV